MYISYNICTQRRVRRERTRAYKKLHTVVIGYLCMWIFITLRLNWGIDVKLPFWMRTLRKFMTATTFGKIIKLEIPKKFVNISYILYTHVYSLHMYYINNISICNQLKMNSIFQFNCRCSLNLFDFNHIRLVISES